MHLRFQRRIPIVPGWVYLNLSKAGISLSIGRSGCWLNFGRGGIQFTAGLPGSGISVREKITGRDLSAK